MKIILTIISILLYPVFSWAACETACTQSGTTWTCSDISYDCVNDAATSATYGDTINLAAGDKTWTSSLATVKNLRFLGAGSTSTKITIDLGNHSGTGEDDYGAIFEFTPDATARNNIDNIYDSGVIEVSGIWFVHTGEAYTVAIKIRNPQTQVIKNIKIHDNNFDVSTTGFTGRAFSIKGSIHGVVYNNSFIDTSHGYVEGNGSGSFLNDRMTVGSGKGWYVEDNVWTITRDASIGSALNSGAGYVGRYNTVTGTCTGAGRYWETHGNQDGGIYGNQIMEIYGNNFTATGGQVADIRDGKNIIAFNVFASASTYLREEDSDLVAGTVLSGGGVLNSCAENQGVSRQTCAFDANAADTCVCQKVHSSYFINNRASTSGVVRPATMAINSQCGVAGNVYDCEDNADDAEVGNDPLEVVENLEYFNYDTTNCPANAEGACTAGVGCGTLANRPESCTSDATHTGVGYFATDLACDSIPTTVIGNTHTANLTGTLYKCVATNTWVAFWTPYTYPHPLRGESGASNAHMGLGSGASMSIGSGAVMTLQ